MALKKGVLFAAVVLFSTLLGTGDCAGGGWFSWPESGGDKAESEPTSSFFVEPSPPTIYKYPTPTFVEDNITAMAALSGNNTIIEWIKHHPWIYGVIGGTGLIIIVLLVAIITVCCCYCYKRRKRRYDRGTSEEGKSSPREPSKAGGHGKKDQATTEQRRKQREIEEKKTAVEAVKGFLVAHSTEYLTQPDDQGNLPADFKQPDMGSRMQKYWFMVEPIPTSQRQPPEYSQLIVTAAPVSQKCPLKFDENMLKGVNKLIGALKPHPYLHKIVKIDYRYDSKQVIIVQPFMSSGSLKDKIYKVSPTTDWSRKYSRRNKGLPTPKIQRYGRQVLEAVMFLYSKDFPPLGHIQSGNIFVDDTDTCRLGGYENTLLGYKTRLYRICRNHLQYFDVIMFGHLIFEMSCGYELTQLRPVEDEYKSIKDDDIREILRYIFKDGFPNSIEQIRNHTFFSVELQTPGFDPIELSEHMKKVLRKVVKAKPREQPTEQPAPGFVEKLKHNIKKSDKSEPQAQGATGTTEVTVHSEKKGGLSFIEKVKRPFKKDKDDEPEKEGLLANDGDDKDSKDT